MKAYYKESDRRDVVIELTPREQDVLRLVLGSIIGEHPLRAEVTDPLYNELRRLGAQRIGGPPAFSGSFRG